jgi:hypothetical protein
MRISLYVAIVLLCLFGVAIALTWPAESIIPSLVYGQF